MGHLLVAIRVILTTLPNLTIAAITFIFTRIYILTNVLSLVVGGSVSKLPILGGVRTGLKSYYP